VPLCQGGAGVGGFLGLCEKVFSLTVMPGVGQKARPGSHRPDNGAPVSGWGRSSGGFVGLCEKVFSFTTMLGGDLPLQVEFSKQEQNISCL
jgi:hypothetical protein